MCGGGFANVIPMVVCFVKNMKIGIGKSFLLFTITLTGVAGASCPDGYVQYDGPNNDGFALNSQGVCAALCPTGRKLMTSTGLSYNLFAEKSVTPSLNALENDVICYADTVVGAGAGINFSHNGTVYSLRVSTPCPIKYEVSYTCGNGATGTPPQAKTIEYGSMLGIGYDYGTCNKTGYYASGWIMDGATKSAGEYVPFKFATNKTLGVRWSPSAYSVVYVCNTDEIAETYQKITYGYRFSPNTTPCLPPFGKILIGYNIQNYDGTDTGVTIKPGESFVWNYDTNMLLSAIWQEAENIITEYELSYSCGGGATGTPPESRTVMYGNLYTPGADIGSCAREGYVFNGWNIGSYSREVYEYYPYTYAKNEELIAQWTIPQYAAVYICNNDTISSEYLSGYYYNTYTPKTNICSAPKGKSFAGYAIQDAYGQDTGDIVLPGKSFKWTYDGNIRLSALWQ